MFVLEHKISKQVFAEFDSEAEAQSTLAKLISINEIFFKKDFHLILANKHGEFRSWPESLEIKQKC